MKGKLALFLFTLASLACSTLPAAVSAPAPFRIDSDMVSESVQMVVTAERLNIRLTPGGVVVKHAYFVAGDLVTVYEVKMVGDYNWCAIAPDAGRWVGCEWLEAR